MANAAAGVIAMQHDLRGQSFGTVSACAAGAHAIGTAARMIRYGDADAVVDRRQRGGDHAARDGRVRAHGRTLGQRHLAPVRPPPRRLRDGRGRRRSWCSRRRRPPASAARASSATSRGYASTSDAHHLTAPEPSGRGAAEGDRAGADATRASTRSDVLYVNAHGTSTPLNDRAETNAIKTALGDELAARMPVSSTKSAIGHLLGAAGAVEAIATLLALRDRIAPPTLNYEEPDEGLDLDYVPSEARPLAERRRPRDRALERVRLRRAQRRPLPGGSMSALADRMPAERISPLLKEPREARRPRAARGALRPGIAARDPLDRAAAARVASACAPGDGVVGGGRHGRRAPGLLLRAGPVASPAARSARRTPRRSCA